MRGRIIGVKVGGPGSIDQYELICSVHKSVNSNYNAHIFCKEILFKIISKFSMIDHIFFTHYTTVSFFDVVAMATNANKDRVKF